MKLISGIRIVNHALVIGRTIIISDIHIGYEEALNKQGILIPRFQFRDIVALLDNLFLKLKDIKIEKIIINGDLKHEFGTISETEWRHTLRLLDYFSKRAKEIILIKGNHDTIIGPIAKKKNVNIKEYEIVGKNLIIHGHEINEDIERLLKKEKIRTIIIGHEHPAVTLRDGPRTEIFKCFLKGKWKKYNLIVMPSFTPLIEGTDVLKEELLSPFLQQSLYNFDVYVIGDKAYHFGKIRNIISDISSRASQSL